MKGLFALVLLTGSQLYPNLVPIPRIHSFIDPTGTYILKGIVKNNKITGHSGEIRVKLLSNNEIALCFYINSGYPDYQSGSILDTLSYQDNQAKYTPAKDRDCSIFFCFSPYTVETQQLYSNPNSGCGFGKGVMTSEIFEKYSWERPIIQDLSHHGLTP